MFLNETKNPILFSKMETTNMKHSYLAILCILIPFFVTAQQANVNLDYNPQKNTDNLTPFSASLISPEVRDVPSQGAASTKRPTYRCCYYDRTWPVRSWRSL